MPRSRQEIISEMVDSNLFSDDEIRSAVKAAPSTPAAPKSLLSKVNDGAMNTVGTVMDAANAPLEILGEAGRHFVEKDPGPMRSTSLVQRFFPGSRTEQPPENPFSLVNKLVTSAAAGASGLPSGLHEAGRRASAAYYADRGVPGAIADAGLAALTGKLAPEVMAAPVTAVENAATMGVNAIRGGVKKGMRVALGPSEEALSARFNRPDAVKNATGFDDLADEFKGTMEGLTKKVETLDNQAWDSLLKLKAEPRTKIVRMLSDVKRGLKVKQGGTVGQADSRAAKTIDGLIEDINNIKQTTQGAEGKGATKATEVMLDQPQIRQIILAVRRNINWDDPAAESTNNALKAFQGKLDTYLKTQNPEYEKIMAPLAQATDALESAKSKFRVSNVAGKGLQATDATVSKFKTFKEENKPETGRVLDAVKRETGVDFKDKIDLTNFSKEFMPGERTRGFARTGAGGLLGFALEPFVPGPPGLATAAGGAAGRAADYYGGAAAAKIIDALVKSKSKIGELLQAAGGPQAASNLDDVIRQALRYQPSLRALVNR